MYKPDYMPDAFKRPINEITGKLPIYRPKKTGRMVIRWLPAFIQDSPGSTTLREAPIADWSKGSPANSEGLGHHHFEPTAVTLWKDGGHLLSSVALDPATGKFVKSPASYAAGRIWPMFEEAGNAIKNGIRVTEHFAGCDSWKRHWIREGGMHLGQALLIEIDGQPKRDPRSGANPKIAVHLPWSAVKDLRFKLFSSAQPGRTDVVASESDNRLGDYVSCAAGRFMAIMPNMSDDKSYYVELLSPWELPEETARALWTPWDQMYQPPQLLDALATLRSMVSPAALGFGLAGSPYEPLLTEDEKRLGQAFRVVQGLTVPQSGYEQAGHYAQPPQYAQAPQPPPAPLPQAPQPQQQPYAQAPQPQQQPYAQAPQPQQQPYAQAPQHQVYAQAPQPQVYAQAPQPQAPQPSATMPFEMPEFPDPADQIPHLPPPAARPPVSPMAPASGMQPPAPPTPDQLNGMAAAAQPSQPLKLRLE